jgi:tRNA(fMet)-specific endonuclease VapC
MKYLLDTNMLLFYLREDKAALDFEAIYQLFDAQNLALISIVSKGELFALAFKNNWGKRRINQLEQFVEQFFIIDIAAEDIVQRYAQIDAFSQGKLKDYPTTFSARNMGKNDIWIAATASIVDAKLVTTDKDFNHLQNNFLNLILIER